MVIMEALDIFNQIIPTAGSIFFHYWWLLLFFVLTLLAPSFWLVYVQSAYAAGIQWALLEIKIPREIRRSPRSMEQVFITIHAIRNTWTTIEDKWWIGEIPQWFSFEIGSFGGEIHLFMRIPRRHRNILEAAMYAQYPDVEMEEVSDDYLNRFPRTYDELSKAGYELFGNELLLVAPDAYPIRTYIDFENPDEERTLDPIAMLLEYLTKMRFQENIAIQILVRPKNDESWRKDGEALIAQIKEKMTMAAAIPAEGNEGPTFPVASPVEYELLRRIDRSISKPGFDVIIRYLYFAPKNIFEANLGQRGVISVFNQYMGEAVTKSITHPGGPWNRFRHNYGAWTYASAWFFPYVFPQKRTIARKRRIWSYFRARRMYDGGFAVKIVQSEWFHFGFERSKTITLNSEELATIMHMPTYLVQTGPLIKQVPARKVGPPAGLPIYGETAPPREKEDSTTIA